MSETEVENVKEAPTSHSQAQHNPVALLEALANAAVAGSYGTHRKQGPNDAYQHARAIVDARSAAIANEDILQDETDVLDTAAVSVAFGSFANANGPPTNAENVWAYAVQLVKARRAALAPPVPEEAPVKKK